MFAMFGKCRHKIMLLSQASSEKDYVSFVTSKQESSSFILDPSYSTYSQTVSALAGFQVSVSSSFILISVNEVYYVCIRRD